MSTVTQRTFSSGELSPSLHSRVDLTKYQSGLRTCLNTIILRSGGTANRAGTKYITNTIENSRVRLIPFILGEKSYIVELGYKYLRILYNDRVYTGDWTNDKIATGITNSNPMTVNFSAPHGYNNGDTICFNCQTGVRQLTHKCFEISNVTANSFTMAIDSTNFPPVTATTLTMSKAVIMQTPYQIGDLPRIHFIQNENSLVLLHSDYKPLQLGSDFRLTDVEFEPKTAYPLNVSGTAGATGTVKYSYKVTAVNKNSAEESSPGIIQETANIELISTTDPMEITLSTGANNLSFIVGDSVLIREVAPIGMTEVKNKRFVITEKTANVYKVFDTDATHYSSYNADSAKLCRIPLEITSAEPTTQHPNTLTWDRVIDAIAYNIYREKSGSGVYGLIGVSSTNTFKDINLEPDFKHQPPQVRNYFIGTNNQPATATFSQQRLILGGTINSKDKIFISKVADYHNFSMSTPVRSDDAMVLSIAGKLSNEIRAMINLSGLIVFTNTGEWVVSSENGGLTPLTVGAKQYSYNGSGYLQPIAIDDIALYQQARGSVIRSLGYDYQVDGYKGDDLTLFSNHLFDGFEIKDWAYQQIPHSILWVVRSDGILLGLTMVKSQNVLAWHRHEFYGRVENVAVVPGEKEDILYLTIFSNGVTRIEKMTSRQLHEIEDITLLDSHVTVNGTLHTSGSVTLSNSTSWGYREDITLTASNTTAFANLIIDDYIYLPDNIRLKVVELLSSNTVKVRPNKTISLSRRNIAISDWNFAYSTIHNLEHLEGKEVAVFGDGFVLANPLNIEYKKIRVTNGQIKLSRPTVKTCVGLPYYSDIETLNIDTINGETLANKSKLLTDVTVSLEKSRGLWAGNKPPVGDIVEGLTELKIRQYENYAEPVRLASQSVNIKIRSEWESNGRIFLRQIDPVPLSVLAISPAGLIPFRR